jgi:hypothetical protein
MIRMVCAAQRSQMYTLPANRRKGPATSFATSESRRPQKEQRIVLGSLSIVTPPIKKVLDVKPQLAPKPTAVLSNLPDSALRR